MLRTLYKNRTNWPAPYNTFRLNVYNRFTSCYFCWNRSMQIIAYPPQWEWWLQIGVCYVLCSWLENLSAGKPYRMNCCGFVPLCILRMLYKVQSTWSYGNHTTTTTTSTSTISPLPDRKSSLHFIQFVSSSSFNSTFTSTPLWSSNSIFTICYCKV